LEGLRLFAFKQNRHRGSDGRIVIPYIYEKMRVVLLCVLSN
jgi:hypothetical protein